MRITITQRLLVTKTTTLVGDGLVRLTGNNARVLFAPGQTVTVLGLRLKSTVLTGISGAGSFLGENLTFASNTAVDGFGAGLRTETAGSLTFSTFVSNSWRLPDAPALGSMPRRTCHCAA